MNKYEQQIADILPECPRCVCVKVIIDTVENESILVGCLCGWGGHNPKEWLDWVKLLD